MPCHELLLEILFIVEAPHFEEGGFHKTHQVLDGPFLLRLLRPTQLHSDAYLQHGVSEDRIPFRDFAVPPPLQGYRLRPIEPSRKATSTCPKSCWLNSPGRPSKRISGFISFGRTEATRAYKAVLPPWYPASRTRRRISREARSGFSSRIFKTGFRKSSTILGLPIRRFSRSAASST